MLLVQAKFLEQIEAVLGEAPTIEHVVVIDDGTAITTVAPAVRRRRRRGLGRRAAAGHRRGRHGVAALHERHDRVPEGRHAHPPQPHRGDAGVGHRVRAAARRAQPRRLPAVPRRRLHRAGHPHPRRAHRADADVRARAVDAARRRARDHRHGDGADDAQHGAPAPEDRRLQARLAARHRLRRGGDARRGAAGGDRALRPDRLLRLRHDRARRQRADVPEVGPRAGRQGRRVPPRLVRHADVPGRRQGRRRGHGRVPAGRRRRDRDPRRAGARRATSATRRARPRRSTTAGSAPATWPGATRRASSTSSTG